LQICVGRKCIFIKMMRLGMLLLQHSGVTIVVRRMFYFGQTLDMKKELGQIELD
jgi:hypothetical protein